MRDAAWGGLCLSSESDRPHEWPYIAWCLRRRVESPRYPDTYREVVRQKYQFSWFNETVGQPDDAVWQLASSTYPGRNQDRLDAAIGCMEWVLWSTEEGALLPPEAMHFYSPISMPHKWQPPSWATASGVDRMTPHGVDPHRFVFVLGA